MSIRPRLTFVFLTLFLTTLWGHAPVAAILQVATFAGCDDNSEGQIGDKVLQNNVWDRDSTGTQCVFQGLFGGLPVSHSTAADHVAIASWMWNWDRTSDIPASYPSLIYGFKPWRGKTTMDKLPARISSLKKLDVSYGISTDANGAYNTSFEIWLTRTAKPTPADITTEIMIWLDSRKVRPEGHPERTAMIDGKKYDVWIGKVEHWKYIAFKAHKPSESGSIHLKSFFDDLIRHGDMHNDTWLSGVELGTEITSGKGRATVSAFDISR